MPRKVHRELAMIYCTFIFWREDAFALRWDALLYLFRGLRASRSIHAGWGSKDIIRVMNKW